MTPSTPANGNPAPALTCWMIWFGILAGMMMIQFFVGHGIPSGPDQGTPPMVLVTVALGAAVISLAIRVRVLPGARTPEEKLKWMIVGLALAEGCGINGIFLIPSEFPHTKLIILIAAVTAILVQAPVYANEK